MKKNKSEHDARKPAPEIVLERVLRPDELPAATPLAAPTPPRRPWAALGAAGLLLVLVLAGYLCWRIWRKLKKGFGCGRCLLRRPPIVMPGAM